MNKFFVFLLLIFSNNFILIAEASYEINHLGLAHTHSHACCINNHGEVCGTFTATNSEGNYSSSFYWSEKVGLVELQQGELFTPHDMNDAGVIVGSKHIVTKMLNGSNKSFSKGYMINNIGFDYSDLGNYWPQSINNNNISVGDYVTEIPYKNGSYSHAPYQKFQEKDAESINYNDSLNLAERYKSKKRHCKRVENLVHAIQYGGNCRHSYCLWSPYHWYSRWLYKSCISSKRLRND
jgi:hypothetical protein